MACVDDKGRLSPSAKRLLYSISEHPLSIQEIVDVLALPLFKVRSSIREMKGFRLIEENEEGYAITKKGIELLKRQ